MKWIAVFLLPLVTGCKMAKFVTEEGVSLENHVIATVTASAAIKCRMDCVDTPFCFSVNVRRMGPTGQVTCELNNSSKTADPQDLIARAESQYHQMAEIEHCTTEQCIYKDGEMFPRYCGTKALSDGWYRFGSKLLKLFPDGEAWNKAELSCQSNGGELVSINNEDENEFISHLIGQVKTNTAGKSQVADIVNHWILDGTDSDISLFDGARYVEEDGVKSLYLNGSGAHATTPAVDFNALHSFTLASWVKLQHSPAHPSTIYGYWGPRHFLFDAWVNEKLRFQVKNNKGGVEPSLNQGSPSVGKWFHAAAVWNKDSETVFLFLDGQNVGTQNVPSDIKFKDDFPSTFDIGLNRDAGHSLIGHLRDLMIIRGPLTGEQLSNMEDPFGGVWIGLNDVNSEGTFHWPDGTHATYTKWASNQPDNQNENNDCVRMTVNERAWDDTSCGKVLPFVCEKKA